MLITSGGQRVNVGAYVDRAKCRKIGVYPRFQHVGNT